MVRPMKVEEIPGHPDHPRKQANLEKTTYSLLRVREHRRKTTKWWHFLISKVRIYFPPIHDHPTIYLLYPIHRVSYIFVRPCCVAVVRPAMRIFGSGDGPGNSEGSPLGGDLVHLPIFEIAIAVD